MNVLGVGLHNVCQHEDALSVQEAGLAVDRRRGASEESILTMQSNLANTYQVVGRLEEALNAFRDVYSGFLILVGEENEKTLTAANNYSSSLNQLQRFEKAKSVLRRTIPMTRRVLGEGGRLTLKMRWNYARALCEDPAATLDNLGEAVTTLEDLAPIARRVLGGSHPITEGIENALRDARATLHAREGDDVSSACDAVEKITMGK